MRIKRAFRRLLGKVTPTETICYPQDSVSELRITLKGDNLIRWYNTSNNPLDNPSGEWDEVFEWFNDPLSSDTFMQIFANGSKEIILKSEVLRIKSINYLKRRE
jgi:hypothetical protein